MKRKILMAVSTIALATTLPAFAETKVGADVNTSVKVEADQPGIGDNIQRGLSSAKETVTTAAENVEEGTKDVYDRIKFTFFADEKDSKGTVITVDERMTADGMLGKPVYNGSKERIGTVKDIILNANGDAGMIVVSDAEGIDLGAKEVAFDYGLVVQREKDGDFIMPLTEDMISKANKFSYDRADADKDGVRVLPAGGYSVETLLKADVVNAKKEKVASVDNISFKGGRADSLIVGFDKVMGMGGDKAALAFSDVTLVKDGEKDYDFQLSASQASQFEAFKQTASN